MDHLLSKFFLVRKNLEKHRYKLKDVVDPTSLAIASYEGHVDTRYQGPVNAPLILRKVLQFMVIRFDLFKRPPTLLWSFGRAKAFKVRYRIIFPG